MSNNFNTNSDTALDTAINKLHQNDVVSHSDRAMSKSEYKDFRKKLDRLYKLEKTDRVQYFFEKPLLRKEYGFLQSEFTDIWCEFCNEKFRKAQAAAIADNADQRSLEIEGGQE